MSHGQLQQICMGDSLKDNKSFTTINAFQKHFTLSNCKPNKIWGIKVVDFTIDH